MKLRKLPATLLLAVLVAIPVFAQNSAPKPERTSEAAGAESGGTNTAEAKPGMEIWKWVNFAILAGILGWLTSKNLGPVLGARSRGIQEGLAAGEKARAEAEGRAAAVQARISNLGEAIAQMKASAREEREREAERIRRDTHMELARVEQQANQEIESAGKLARLEVQRFAAKLAIDLAEQKVRARMSPETQSALINNFLGDTAGSAHAG